VTYVDLNIAMAAKLGGRGLPRHGGLEELSERLHGAINIGRSEYEQVMIFFLDFPEAVAQPSEQNSA